MGSWGPGVFENDHVMDWLVDLEQMKSDDDISPILTEALNWVIEHEHDAPGYQRYDNESGFDPTLMTAMILQMPLPDGWTRTNLDKPSEYLKWDRRFDLGAAAADIIASVAGHPMSSLLVLDQLTGGYADISKVINGRPKPSNELITKAVRVVDIVLRRNELFERWIDRKTSKEWMKLVRNLKSRLADAIKKS
jgi:hypothetical protein